VADSRTRRWPGLASLIVAVIGLAVSVYLTIEHYTASTTFACPESATINCQKVTTSHWSHLGPIPVAVLGLVFFVAMTALCLPAAWRVRALEPVRVIGAAVGVVVALVLVWIELFRVDAICLYCTAVHVCSLILLGTVLWTTSELRAERAA
jgi:uncharacterized membrane protein